ncbi:MAG TPA: hypothetical protein VF648_07120 [Pyrinomonadaceae bacterium]|jgi:hypothetical protein
MKNAKITKFTTSVFGMKVEVEHIGRGATATVKEPNHFLYGVYKYASTMDLAFELLKEEICKELVSHVCGGLTIRR